MKTHQETQLAELGQRLAEWYRKALERMPRAEHGNSSSITFTCYDAYENDDGEVFLSLAVKTEDEESGV